ncbi:tautomerase family protein [Kocuria arenosa]|uniref:tautomerase family protein n=1 Tax=Kocuria arenosa TaxID=3071446 RepID=UPI0034D6EDD2
MPIVTINMVAGRDRAMVQDCLREVAKTVSRTLDAPLSSVRVLVNEVDPDLWTVGTTLKSEEHRSTPTPGSP